MDAGGLSPAKDKRAKSTEKTGCPTCVPLLIDAIIIYYIIMNMVVFQLMEKNIY